MIYYKIYVNLFDMCVVLCEFMLKTLNLLVGIENHDAYMLISIMCIDYAPQVFEKLLMWIKWGNHDMLAYVQAYILQLFDKISLWISYEHCNAFQDHAMLYFLCYRVLGVFNTQKFSCWPRATVVTG